MRIPALLACFLLAVAVQASEAANAAPVVLVVGDRYRASVEACRTDWPAALTLVYLENSKELPADADALATRAAVLVVASEDLDAAHQVAVEAFVRGGGGLLLDAGDASGVWCDWMSPGIGLDHAEEALPTLAPADGSSFAADLLAGMPRPAKARNVTPADRSPLGLMGMLSPFGFGKPVWNGEWRELLVGSPPRRLCLAASARYGAGTVVALGFRLDDQCWPGWSGFPRFASALARVVLPTGPVRPIAAPAVAMRGFAAPGWWAKPLENGLKDMGQKQGFDDFLLPPETLREAGWEPAASARTLLLFGQEAAADPGAATAVLRAPAGAAGPEPEFLWRNLSSVTSVEGLVQVSADGVEAPVRLPAQPPAVSGLPRVVGAERPALVMPAAWRIAALPDPDSERDLREGWQQPAFDDSRWENGAPGQRTVKLFGAETGVDGALWYRGVVEVPNEAVQPEAALVIEADAHHLRVYVDGKEIACEKRLVVLPLSRLGAGKHLLAVRTFGELRANKGLLRVEPVALGQLFRPDPDGRGWREGWMKPDAELAGWTPVGGDFSNDPVAQESRQGWTRCTVEVPADAPPAVVEVDLRINQDSVLFLNGERLATRGWERGGGYSIPSRLLKPGRNTVCVFARWTDNQGRVVSVWVRPRQPLTFRATLNVPRAGLALRARLAGGGRPASALMLVDGVPAGGLIDESPEEQDAVLIAPRLQPGEHRIELRIEPRSAEAKGGLQSLELVEPPTGAAMPVAGWERRAANGLGEAWWASVGDWEAVPTASLQDWRKTWTMVHVPDLADPAFAYRTCLRFTAEQLQQPQVLFMRAPLIKRLLVNGRPVEAQWARHEDQACWYALNGALKEGDNQIAFLPEEGSWRGLDLPVPPGRERGAYLPLLRSDRAPLLAAHPLLAAVAPAGVFPVTALEAPAGSEILLTWPGGKPAAVLVKTAGRREVRLAPGLVADLLPAPALASRSAQSGLASTIEYDYAQRVNRDLFAKTRLEALLPPLLALAEGPTCAFTTCEPGAEALRLVAARGDEKGPLELAWRFADFEGQILASGAHALSADDALDLPWPAKAAAGASLGRSFRLRAVLLADGRRRVAAWIERVVEPRSSVALGLRLDGKVEAQSAANSADALRVLHQSVDQLMERHVYLPGEAATATAELIERDGRAVEAELRFRAIPAAGGQPVELVQKLRLPPFGRAIGRLELPAAAMQTEQPWRVEAELVLAGRTQARAERSFAVIRPRGALLPLETAMRGFRQTGGYMWQMTPHALAIEHRWGSDAQPVKDGNDWWMRVRAAGDGNWMVANGIHVEDQNGLLWGPFYDQPRGEVMDSYGWFPNGQAVREWWAPSAMREPLRSAGRRPVVMAMSDWWQYDSGYIRANYQTMEMFRRWLTANRGKVIAGQTVPSEPPAAATLGEAVAGTGTGAQSALWEYFCAAGLARLAAWTGERLDEVCPGSTQYGQGTYAHHLPGVPGGVALAPQWSKAESLGTLDADNHPFAGDWQYGLEATTFRALGVENGLHTSWESPLRYHRYNDAAVSMLPLNPAGWRRRLLDSRFMAVAGADGSLARLLNLGHVEARADVENQLLGVGLPEANIGSGVLPWHWWIKDRLAAFSMSVAQARSRSPLLLIGESDLKWDEYFGTLGHFREAGLCLGGGVSIALLDKLDPKQLPGLVWCPAARVDGAALKAIERHLRAGVPLLILGKLPKTLGEGPDLASLIGLAPADEAKGAAQALLGPATAWPEGAGGEAGPGTEFLAPPAFAAVAPAETLVSRQGRSLVAWRREGIKAVYFGLVLQQWRKDDPLPRRIAVRAFSELMEGAPMSTPGSSAQVFTGLDGRTWAVLLNHEQRATTAILHLPGAKGPAVEMVGGRPLVAKAEAGALVVEVPLGPGDAALVAVGTAR